MIEVIAFLLENFHDIDACPSEEALGSMLEQIGFNDTDIENALLLLNILEERRHCQTPSFSHPNALRQYLPEESDNIPREALGLLHFLEQNQALSAEQREFVLMALQHLSHDQAVSVHHAKVLTLLILWADKIEVPVLIGDELMMGLMQTNALLN